MKAFIVIAAPASRLEAQIARNDVALDVAGAFANHVDKRVTVNTAYGVFAHRHAAEIEQELGTSVTFVPHLVPLDRGIFETIYARLRPGVDESAVASALTKAYADSPFVRLTGADLPEIKHVAHTNFCDIGWKVSNGQLVMVSCIDNLVKGAAGQAIQNFNVAFGVDEATALN